MFLALKGLALYFSVTPLYFSVSPFYFSVSPFSLKLSTACIDCLQRQLLTFSLLNVLGFFLVGRTSVNCYRCATALSENEFSETTACSFLKGNYRKMPCSSFRYSGNNLISRPFLVSREKRCAAPPP